MGIGGGSSFIAIGPRRRTQRASSLDFLRSPSLLKESAAIPSLWIPGSVSRFVGDDVLLGALGFCLGREQLAKLQATDRLNPTTRKGGKVDTAMPLHLVRQTTTCTVNGLDKHIIRGAAKSLASHRPRTGRLAVFTQPRDKVSANSVNAVATNPEASGRDHLV